MAARTRELSFVRNGERFRQGLVAALAAGRSADAIRIFGEGLAHGVVPKGVQLHRWLQANLGKQVITELVAAYAKQPCFACDSGMESCESCDGHGRWKDGAICDRCVGIGVARCAFCNGTGLVTHNAIPAGLQLHVMVRRVALATSELEAVLKQPLPQLSHAAPHSALKECARQLKQVDRPMGALENALLFLRERVQARPREKGTLAKVMKFVLRHAVAGTVRTRAIVKCMARSAECEAQSQRQLRGARRLAARRASFYKSLLTSVRGFSNTGLDRPLLSRAVKRLLPAALDSNRREP
jgi:hypothetical protein